jgi:hypothetical protein
VLGQNPDIPFSGTGDHHVHLLGIDFSFGRNNVQLYFAHRSPATSFFHNKPDPILEIPSDRSPSD